jgi:hypothetical protein
MESLRSWKCSSCGRSGAAVAALDATGRCQSCADPNTSGYATKEQVLAQLRDRYREARKLVSSTRPYANLEWVLAAMRNPDQTASYWADRTVELVALWLEDLAAEIDRLFPQEVTGEIAEGALSAYRARRSLAQGLRDATGGFVAAYLHSAGPAPAELHPRPVAGSKGQGKNQRLSPGIEVSQRLVTRDFGPEPFPCVMCGHEKATHTVGTDGAGWCGEGPGCECGGFQEWRSLERGQARNLTLAPRLS